MATSGAGGGKGRAEGRAAAPDAALRPGALGEAAMPAPRTVRTLAVYLGVLAAGAASLGAPAVVGFLRGYAGPAGLWVLSAPATEAGRGRRS
jgi:hypothetical protein